MSCKDGAWGTVMMGVDTDLVRSNALDTEREVHKTLQSTVHVSMIMQIFILLMKSNSRMP